jgi:TRAP-type mannitol/chloroaromatic compound transport system permease small subunit
VKVLLAVSRLIDTVNEGVGRLTLWLVVLMVGIGAFNAIVRSVDREFGTRLSSNTLLELQWYLFALVFLFMSAYLLKHNQHIRVDVIYSRLSRRAQAWVDMLGSVLWLIPAVMALFFLTIPLVEFSVRVREMSPDPGGLPRWPLKLAMLPALLLLALQGLSEFIKNLAFLRGDLPNLPRERVGEVI